MVAVTTRPCLGTIGARTRSDVEMMLSAGLLPGNAFRCLDADRCINWHDHRCKRAITERVFDPVPKGPKTEQILIMTRDTVGAALERIILG